MIAVVTDSESYRVAVAELPLSTRPATDRSGTIVVVPGGGQWSREVRAAADAGAAAVVVSRPVRVDAEVIESLALDLGPMPVIVERPFLRHDAVADLRAASPEAPPASVVVVDAVAAASVLDLIVRDAVGWLRVLTGSPPVLRSADDGLALFDAGPNNPPAVVTAVCAPDGSPRIHAHALGETRWELDATEAGVALRATTDRGGLTLPRRHESSERLALRRAVEALDATTAPRDLTELAADTAIAAQIIRGIRCL